MLRETFLIPVPDISKPNLLRGVDFVCRTNSSECSAFVLLAGLPTTLGRNLDNVAGHFVFFLSPAVLPSEVVANIVAVA